MLDYNNDKISINSDSNQCIKEKVKRSLKNEMTAKIARRASFVSLASVLGACNFGGGSDSVAPLNISAIKGPLSGALAFIDRDGDGAFDEGEEFAVTGSTGGATINPTSALIATQKLVITSISAGQTIGDTTYETATVDTNTGGTVADLVLKAPSNSTVVTPVTTLVAETGLSEAAVKEVLGLPAEMDVLNFNPFAEDLTEAEKVVALEAEKVALKVYTTVSTIQASAKSSGLDAVKAFATAIEAVADVVKEQSAAGAKADLADSSIIDKVVTKTETVLTAKLEEAGFDAAAVTAAVTANKAVLATAKAQIKTVNDAADAITSFDAAELGAIAKLAVKSGEEAAAAVTAEKAAPGSGAAKFSMKTADAVATAKATAKAEVEVAQAEAKGEETPTKTVETGGGGGAAAVVKNFVLTDGTTVDWAITTSGGAASQTITTSTAPDATYTVSGSTMTINLGQKFALKTVQDLLTEKADLTLALSLSSLPTTDDDTANTTTVTITEGTDGTISSGEGQIRASVKSTFEATSSTQTDFNFAAGDPISITYTPRSGNSDLGVNISNLTPNVYTVDNDGNFNNKGGQAVLELMATEFFTRLDAVNTADNNWAKNNILSKFVTATTPAVHLSINTADLNLYNGSTKINAVETTLNILDNPTTGGLLTGTPRTGTAVSVTDVGDLDGLGTVTHQWQRSADKSTWTDINDTANGSNTKTYTLQAADANSGGFYVRYTASYTDKQNNAYTGNDKFVTHAVKDSNGTETKVTANQSPGGTFKVTGGNYLGSTLTADGSGITDADGMTGSTVAYHWEKSVDGGSNWTDISGATSSTYTIQSSDVADKNDQVRGVASFTDDLGATEVVNHTGTGNIAKPILYLQKIGSSSTSKIEIGIFLDDELLTTTAHKKMKTWEVEITPVERWDVNFDDVTNGFKDGAGDKHDSYFMNSDSSYTSNSRMLDTSTFGGTSKDIFSTGGYTPKISTLDGSAGKAAINPQGTGSVVNLGDTDDWATSALAANDIKLVSLYLDPKDANSGNIVEWNVTANTHYDFWNGSAGTPIDSALSYFSDPYVFAFTL